MDDAFCEKTTGNRVKTTAQGGKKGKTEKKCDPLIENQPYSPLG